MAWRRACRFHPASGGGWTGQKYEVRQTTGRCSFFLHERRCEMYVSEAAKQQGLSSRCHCSIASCGTQWRMDTTKSRPADERRDALFSFPNMLVSIVLMIKLPRFDYITRPRRNYKRQAMFLGFLHYSSVSDSDRSTSDRRNAYCEVPTCTRSTWASKFEVRTSTCMLRPSKFDDSLTTSIRPRSDRCEEHVAPRVAHAASMGQADCVSENERNDKDLFCRQLYQ